jgi:ubiquinone/menaquinone biosynthesis C-methylase UbiE
MASINTGESSAVSREPRHHYHEVFSASRARHLDSRLRRFIYRPDHLTEHYVKPGDRVLDYGCGLEFFTREFAKMAGDTGRVIAVDLQKEMLQILQEKQERNLFRTSCS